MWKATGAVLAGGKSLRMGTDKALLLLDNQSLLERAVEKLKSMFEEVIVVSNEKEKYNLPGIREVTDIYCDRGPVGGIHAALENASHDRVFITACDMPFWEQELAEVLLQSCEGYDAAVPRVKGFFEPLLAVYTKNCTGAIEDNLNRDIHKVTGFYSMLRINAVESELLKTVCKIEKSFYNINTGEDLAEISKIR